jgi:hypothetical protein
MRLAPRMAAQFIQIVDVERIEIQKPQQGLEGMSLRIRGFDHNNFGISHDRVSFPSLIL